MSDFIFVPVDTPPDPVVSWQCPDCESTCQGHLSGVRYFAEQHVLIDHTPAS